MAKSTFLHDLRTADSEKLVESAYHTELKRSISNSGGTKISISTSVKTDGIIEAMFDGIPELLRLIIENKLNETFSCPLTRSKALAQVVYYLKKIEDLGNEPPNVVLVGDRDECFVLHANNLDEYLSKPYDWTISPSEAGKKNSELVKALVTNSTLQAECFVYTIDEDFQMSEVVEKALDLVQGIKRLVRITERRFSKVFDYFSLRILKRNSDGTSKYEARAQVELFMLLVVYPEDCYSHPKKKDTGKFKNNEVKINTDTFESYMKHFKFDCNAIEKKDLTAICDRLIEDSERRNKGDFYTPSIWVDEAHKMLADQLGPNWKDTFVVWDPAWGTGNLTRDYNFLDLYCSTLHEHDLKIGEKYNQCSTKFQYDFLNDDVKEFDKLLQITQAGYTISEKDFVGTILYAKAPNLIKSLLNGKPLVFLINPPFGTSGEMSSAVSGKDKKTGVANTLINAVMKKYRIGASSQQLYAQFLFRIHQLYKLFRNKVAIGLYSPVLLITGSHFIGLRKELNKDFRLATSMLFQANQFADVKENWGISFTIWDSNLSKNNFVIEIKDYQVNGVMTTEKNKILYSIDDSEEKGSSWVKPLIKERESTSIFTMSNALNITDGDCMISPKSLGYLIADANCVEKNTQFVMLLNTKLKGHLSTTMLSSDNLYRALSYYSARRLITVPYATWVNSKDEYMIPDITHPSYSQWEQDCLVYSIFNAATNLSSLRGIPYFSSNVDILNNFFFMSREEMKQLALGSNSNDDVYYDLQNHATNERFLYTILQQSTLSPDAQAVLNKARELVIRSFKNRKHFNLEHPEYHITTWDAGWYQIKGLLREYSTNALRDFTLLYRAFEERMRPLVFEIGFLYE